MKKRVVGKNVSKEKGNVQNIISIVLGSCSIVASFFIPYVVAVTGVLGIIFAYMQKGKGQAKANRWAFILNVVGIFLAIVLLTLALFAIVLNNNLLNGVAN